MIRYFCDRNGTLLTEDQAAQKYNVYGQEVHLCPHCLAEWEALKQRHELEASNFLLDPEMKVRPDPVTPPGAPK